MSEEKAKQQLKKEGFRHIYVWQDGPNTQYAEHTHGEYTAHIILDGEMTLNVGGKEKTYKKGERCDVEAGQAHSAKMGSKGCRYIIGEK